MTMSPALLLHQWLSPAFPVGAFSYSHGLEVAIADGRICDTASTAHWVEAALDHGAGRSDAILLAAAYHAGLTGHDALGDLARALSPSAERLAETDRMGAAFARTLRALHDLDLPDAPYPVVLGQAARACDLPLLLTLNLFLQAFAANLVSAALRLVPLGQTEAQGLILHLTDRIAEIAVDAEPGETDQIGTATIALDIASMAHETLPTRLFQS